MSITYSDILKRNKDLKAVDVKGKEYIEVAQRVKAFRMIYPEGTITTDILSIENGVVTMKATAMNGDGKILATGLAQEKESSSYINKTSYIENCETSAVGRALGFLGLGIDLSIASADEMLNAVNRQNKPAGQPQPQKQQTIRQKPQTQPQQNQTVNEPIIQSNGEWSGKRCEECGIPVDAKTAYASAKSCGGHIFCSPAHAQKWLSKNMSQKRQEKGME
jgi:hypothetical protein